MNDFLRLDYHKIEELSDAVAFCHLIDAVFPGKVPIHRLNFSAKTHSERTANLKILEKAIKVANHIFERYIVLTESDFDAELRLVTCRARRHCKMFFSSQ